MSNLRSQMIVAAIFAAIGGAALCWFVKFAEPPERTSPSPYRQDYSEKPLEETLTATNIQQQLVEIAAAGAAQGDEKQTGRLSGSPGFYRTEQLIKDVFSQAGLSITTQEFEVVVPVTEYCEILDSQNKPLEGVRLYPFAPSGLTPISLPKVAVDYDQGCSDACPHASPDEDIRRYNFSSNVCHVSTKRSVSIGEISAKLVAMESAELKYLNGNQPSNTIALTTLDSAASWLDLAGVGVKAVIVREDEAMNSLRANPDQPANWTSLTTPYETTYPRFLARGPIEKFAGAEVKIRCKVTWRAKRVRNVIGVLSGGNPKQEALVLTAFYDSNSVVPDLAPGGEQAVSVAVLLEYAKALAQYSDQLQRDVIFVATAGHAQSLAGVSRLMEAIETFSARRADYRPFEDRRAEHERKLGFAELALDALDDLSTGTTEDTEQQSRNPSNSCCSSATLLAEKNIPPAAECRSYRGDHKEEQGFHDWMESTFKIPAGEIRLDRKEEALQKRLQYLRAGNSADAQSLLDSYVRARKLEDRASNLMALPLEELIQREEFKTWGYADRARKFYADVAEYHRQQINELADLIAVRDLFACYQRTLTVNLELNSGGSRRLKDMSVLVGIGDVGNVVEPQVTEIRNVLVEKAVSGKGEPQFRVISWGARDAKGSDERPNLNSPLYSELESEAWFKCGRLAFTVCNYEFYPPRACTPEDTFGDLPMEVLKEQVPTLGKGILSMAFGRGGFKTIASDTHRSLFALHGTVYGNAGTLTAADGHAGAVMGKNTYVRVLRENYRSELDDYKMRGIRPFPILKTNPYGEYEKALNFEFLVWNKMTADAIRFGDNGEPLCIRDMSSASQSVFHNENFPGSILVATSGWAPKPVNIGLFRCSPVAFFNQVNPQTFRPFKRVDYLNKSGMSKPARFYFGKYTAFLEPDFTFYAGLQDGAAENEEILVDRAFLLNVNPDEPIEAGEPEVYGEGYLAADTPSVSLPYIDTAASMIRTDEKRLRLQQQFGMADEQMLSFQECAKEWLAEAKKQLSKSDIAAAANAAGSSLAYAINNHPVIRNRTAHAVLGILWYLGLLVPFVFFFEKLIFGFTDIRKQLLTNGAVFLVIFGILRAFHPAFQMVRSSLMILLGFVILLLSLLVTLMVGGKFKQNLKELRRREGWVEGADIHRGGVIGAAFMLGLNNMRRRKVRTALTCVTLILITFAMICLTSISTDLVSIEYPTGRSAWNGILIRDQNYMNLDDSQINHVRQIYGYRFPITVTKWLTGSQSMKNVELGIEREFEVGGTKVSKRTMLNSAIQMDWNEPVFSGIDRYLLTKRGWFPRPPMPGREAIEAAKKGETTGNFVILPDTAAQELGVSIDDVNNGRETVSIRGLEYEVLGIIDSVELTKRLGLDGRSILPYDLNSAQTLGTKGDKPVIPEDVGHLAGSQVVIVNQLPPARAGIEQAITVSCCVLFPDAAYRSRSGESDKADRSDMSDSYDKTAMIGVEYKEQRRLVLEYLERIGEPAYYAIDGISYYGYRQRARTVAGAMQLLVPILIAAFTVFNTMRGSVYERKEEIRVYNAVGIAPNHVFFMFMAEACVYAVIGAMCGYVLSQGVGRVLTALHFTGGLNMDYSSIETIYASLAIVAAVLLSTILPACDAARLASPSGVASWTMPVARGDTMDFNLPFTFTPRDRVAVIAYFHRWLEANGAGSSGPFYCSQPEACLKRTEEQASSQLCGGRTSVDAGVDRVLPRSAPSATTLTPVLGSTVWLKPYDLGVSQRMEISLPTDPETGEFIARIKLVRSSGHIAAWQRTVKPFLGSLRKQFLNWRATTDAERGEMFEEAKRILCGWTGDSPSP